MSLRGPSFGRISSKVWRAQPPLFGADERVLFIGMRARSILECAPTSQLPNALCPFSSFIVTGLNSFDESCCLCGYPAFKFLEVRFGLNGFEISAGIRIELSRKNAIIFESSISPDAPATDSIH